MPMNDECQKCIDALKFDNAFTWLEIDIYRRGFKAGWDACYKEIRTE